MQNVWGEENVPENALSRKFLDPPKRASGLLCRGFLYRKNRVLTPEGGGKRTVRGGGPKPFLGRGVIREVFHPPPFSTPPWRPLTRVGEPPVALHVSQQISSESWGFSGVAVVPRYSPPKKACRTCRPSTERGVAHQAASEKVSRYIGRFLMGLV